MRLLPVLLFLIASVAECLMLSRVLVPQYKLYGEDAVLRCDYDLGRDRLYAVKWYKDNEEFFRYVPRFNPPIYTHPVEGVRVDTPRSNDKKVILRSLTVRSSGGYRCEVSAEAPSFASIMGEGRMTVVYLPKDPPQITGHVRQEYEVGNVLDLNCTSAKSFPPAKLSWYINDSPVHVPPGSISIYPASLATAVETQQTQQNGLAATPIAPSSPPQNMGHLIPQSSNLLSSLMISSLRLQLQLESHHFGPQGTARVRCVARISPLFWQDGDEKILSGGYRRNGGGGGYHGSGHHHGTRHGRKKMGEFYGGGGGSSEEGGVEVEGGDGGEGDRPEIEESHVVNAHNQNNVYRGSGHHNSNNHVVYRGGGGGRGNFRHGGHRREGESEEMEQEGEENDDEEEEDEYYGLGLPAFQREALVLVRGSCSSLKPTITLLLLAGHLISTLLLTPNMSQSAHH